MSMISRAIGRFLRTKPRPNPGFTLMELLVVIAIGAVLMALLLPALAHGKAQTQSASCKSRLRQIGLALNMYVSDSRRYPPAWHGSPEPFQTWAQRLYPTAPQSWTNTSWQCPAYLAQGGLVKVVVRPHTAIVYTSYAYNSCGMAGPTNHPKLGLGTASRSTTLEPEVVAPSQMITVGDSRTFRNMDNSVDGRVEPLHGFEQMDPWNIFKEETAPLHGNGYNILFADGHVALLQRSDYLYPPRTAPNWNRDNQAHPEAWAPKNQWAVRN